MVVRGMTSSMAKRGTTYSKVELVPILWRVETMKMFFLGT